MKRVTVDMLFGVLGSAHIKRFRSSRLEDMAFPSSVFIAYFPREPMSRIIEEVVV